MLDKSKDNKVDDHRDEGDDECQESNKSGEQETETIWAESDEER